MNEVLDSDFERSLRAALAEHADRAPQAPEWSGSQRVLTAADDRPSRRWVTVAASILVAIAGVGLLWAMGRGGGTDTTPSDTIPPTSTADGLTSAAWTATIAPSIAPRAGYVSVPTDGGWFVWGGWTTQIVDNQPTDVSEQDGAYLESTTGTWRTLPAAPITNDIRAAAGVWTGTEVIVIVAYPEPQIAAFDPSTFKWRRIEVSDDLRAAWPRGDGGHYSTGFQRFAGGRLLMSFLTNARPVLIEVDPATGDWSLAPEPPVTPDDLIDNVATSDDQLFVVEAGQRNSDSACIDESTPMHVFDPAAGTWTTVFLPYVHWQPAIVAWTDAGLLAAGGRVCDTQAPVRTAALFDPFTSTWTDVADMTADLPFVIDTPLVEQGRVAAVGEAGSPIVYDIANDAWWNGPRLFPTTDVGDVALAAVPGGIITWSASPFTPAADGSFSCCTPEPNAASLALPSVIPHATPAEPAPGQPASPSTSATACSPGRYILVQGDTPSTVAAKFGLTVDELAGANANNPGFDSFVVGTEIAIPPVAAATPNPSCT